ncbi:Fc.00g112370.m01.CDS01 [Cosmosporella sp. VM-42]
MFALNALVIFLTSMATALPNSLAVPLESTPIPTTLATSIVTETPIPSLKCDLKYCESGTSWCMYFAGFTTFDRTAGGQKPGETITSIGLCPPQSPEPVPTGPASLLSR